jgi:hypothetical protein
MERGMGELGYDGVRARLQLPGGGPAGVAAGFVRWGNVAFVGLDANDVSTEITRNAGYSGGAQTAWLDATLGALRADPAIDWILVGFHHCAYCTNAVHASDGGVRDAWVPLFEQHRVDLVLNGHNHCYERAHVNDLTYLTVGGGGQAAYPSSLAPLSYVTVDGGVRLPETAEWSLVRYNDNSLVVLDVDSTADTMTVSALSTAGTPVDAFTLTKRAQPSGPSGPSGPSQPGGPATTPTTASTVAPAPAGPTRGAELARTGGSVATPLLVGAAAATAAVGLRAAKPGVSRS